MEEKISPSSCSGYRPLAQAIASEGWRLWLLFALIFVSYLISMPKTVMLEDDGLFIMSSYFLGIAHPPGYPLHTLIGHLFTQVPIGSVASRVHAMSGFFGALGCILVALISLQLLHSRTAAYAAALMLAWSPVYWSQSIIAEVYTLNSFFFLLILLLLLEAVEYHRNCADESAVFRKSLSIRIAAIAFIYGLSLTNHWPLMLLGTTCFLIIAWPLRREIASRFASVTVCLLAGLTPYLWMYLYTPPPPAYTFMGPINNLTDLWFYISRQIYSNVDSSITAGVADKILFAKFFASEAIRQLFPVGSLFAVIGFITQWKTIGKGASLALLAGFIASSLLLIILLNFDFDELHRSFFRVYLLPAFSIIAIWSAVGIASTLKTAPRLLKHPNNKTITYAILLLASGSVLIINFNKNFRHNDNWSAQYANALFSSVEKNTYFFTDSDSTTGVIGYFHHVEKRRPDLTLMNSNGLLYSNRIVSPKSVNSEERETVIENFLGASSSNIEFTSEPDLSHGEIYNGLTYRVSFDLTRGQRIFQADSAQTVQYLIDLANSATPETPWENLRHKELLHNAIPLFVSLHIKKAIPAELSRGWIDITTQTLKGKLILVYSLLGYNRPHEFGSISSLLESASKQLINADKQERSLYYALLGKQQLTQQKIEKAKENLLRAIDIWPHPTRNIAFGELHRVYLSQGKESEFTALSASILEGSNNKTDITE